jgi:AcrR family transcriptional regulator
MQADSHNESELDLRRTGRKNGGMCAEVRTGRANQKLRTRTAIVDATRGLIRNGTEITMPAVARAAMVSEATAYRYFPDLVSLLREAVVRDWPSPDEALAPVAGSQDPVERISFATEYLLRETLTYEGAVRAMISASVVRPDAADVRPVRRFGLIDKALAPLEATLAASDPQRAAHRLRGDSRGHRLQFSHAGPREIRGPAPGAASPATSGRPAPLLGRARCSLTWRRSRTRSTLCRPWCRCSPQTSSRFR